MARAARRPNALLPVLLCALWSLLLLQAPGAQAAPTPAITASPAPGPTPPTTSPAHLTVSPGSAPGARHLAAPPEPHLAPVAVVRLPAAVEHSVRFPAPPGAPTAAAVDLSVPARGVLAGDPRRERAPPGDRHHPRDPRGPPSPRHS
ncbi:hypothetical protein ACFXGT_32130 [Streptomyces sp. NPDC059352]|uniref:hypothetical protein n=1 Tax=Streptomyces sp. NPDC059352 TaxID=3346810 RepID=UPI0036C99749